MGLSRGEGRQVFGWMVTCARSGPRESAAALRGSGELGASGSGGLREYWCKHKFNSTKATWSLNGTVISTLFTAFRQLVSSTNGIILVTNRPTKDKVLLECKFIQNQSSCGQHVNS